MGQIKRHKKQYKKSKPIQKSHVNSKFKHRGSTTVERLKKQIELEKTHLQSHQEYEDDMLGAVSGEEEEEVNHFNDLVQDLSASGKQGEYKNYGILLITCSFQ